MKFLNEEFLSTYPNHPEDMTPLASFVFYRTYSRWVKDHGRRETFKEAIARAVEYNIGVGYEQLLANKYDISDAQMKGIKAEAEVLFDNIFNRRQFLSGRTHWVGGSDTKVADKFPLSNFNCAFIEVTKWEDICEVMYLLLVGVGVGIKATRESIKDMIPIRINYDLIHSDFKELPKAERLEHTTTNIMENSYAKIYVGDSKEGWVEALRSYIDLLTNPTHTHIKHIKISYNSIRPKGERLNTFGGRASGHEPLKEMFINIDRIIKGKMNAPMTQISANYVRTRPIHILDIVNLLGSNVVVGGVRRTAEIFLCDEDDEEVIKAKEFFWENLDTQHRAMSNNSIAFEAKPTRERLHEILESIKVNGEPGFINLQSAKRRRPNAKGVNPCGEILLDSKGVCNLTTTNIMKMVKENALDYSTLEQAMRLSTRAGIRMTCLDLELQEWNHVHQRDRLVGVSLTGWQDAMSSLNYSEAQQTMLLQTLRNVCYEESIMYSQILRIPTPLLITTIKPEGTLSQVADGVSSGLHVSHSEYYIRRIRINADDPLVMVAKELGWHIEPEHGTPGNNHKERMKNARTLVFGFPVKSGATKTRTNQSLKEQFDTYFMFQEHYTDHNSSITISVRDEEWEEAEQIIWDRWDEVVGISLLPYNDTIYPLAPYESIDESTYKKLTKKLKPFDFELLAKYEFDETEKDLENMQSCDSGICPII